MSIEVIWGGEADAWGLIDYVPDSFPKDVDLMHRFESLGDNCEFGFVQRFHGAEPSSLLRWATAPLHGVIKGLADGWEKVFADENMRPWGVDMAWDDVYQCAFHGETRCEPDEEGQMQFVLSGDSLLETFAKDRSKIRYLRDKTLEGLKNPSKIYVVKANDGLEMSQLSALKAALNQYGDHRLLAVVPESSVEFRGLARVDRHFKMGTISELASYTRVERSAYGEWTNLLRAAAETPWS